MASSLACLVGWFVGRRCRKWWHLLNVELNVLKDGSAWVSRGRCFARWSLRYCAVGKGSLNFFFGGGGEGVFDAELVQ